MNCEITTRVMSGQHQKQGRASVIEQLVKLNERREDPAELAISLAQLQLNEEREDTVEIAINLAKLQLGVKKGDLAEVPELDVN